MFVSVLTAAYNTPGLVLRECWESLQAQTLAGWELILVDDASDRPDTVEELDRIGTDPRATLIRLPENVGSAAARNAGLERCAADLVAVLDSDDIALPVWLERQTAYMATHCEVAICGCQVLSFSNHDGRLRGATTHPPEITADVIDSQARDGRIWFLNQPGVIYRREAILRLGGYDPALRRGQDFELWMRAFRAGLIIHNQPDVLMRYRRRD